MSAERKATLGGLAPQPDRLAIAVRAFAPPASRPYRGIVGCDLQLAVDPVREKFQTLNRVCLTDAEFQRLLEQITTPDVFAAAHTLREYNSFERDDGTRPEP